MSKNIWVIVSVIVLGAIVWYAAGAFSGSSKISQIEDSVAAIRFSANIEKEQCGGGGVDTSEWCTYAIEAPLTQVARDLAASGYSVKNKDGSQTEFVGGTPVTTINISASGSRTLLQAKILEDGKTI